ncbi:MAG: hypothetical protein LCH95_04765 [Proteobacteria bacterium]|nr:hypothetical protein [Pseudomonadota bacterium]
MDEVMRWADLGIRISVVAFMVGNLLAIGLETDARAAAVPLRDGRFLVVVMVVDWLVGPALAVAVVRLLPMAEPYAVGLLLISLAPAAPFLPMMVRRAGGDIACTAAFMLIAAIGTILLMPLGVPRIVPGLSVEPWAVARPLVVLLFLPMAAGVLLRTLSAPLAGRLLKAVRPVASLATLALLVAVAVRHFQGFANAVGSFAIAGQLLYAVGLVVAGWLVAGWLPRPQRSVVALGACTRNLGAALAPLLIADPDPRTIVMVALGVPITLAVTAVAAPLMRPRSGA